MILLKWSFVQLPCIIFNQFNPTKERFRTDSSFMTSLPYTLSPNTNVLSRNTVNPFKYT